ncbi:hypothetical protein BpHYR1_052612 [Brachionus plicatilis]|uniref:Uncharacterized protein n=1 Tax=Brachionus plicatilis TaxID=10195 RepID=A0A3M7T512_BRAPC|nr:hypothetical protein BpHYR1_052612 [Brachionus plicatilis]
MFRKIQSNNRTKMEKFCSAHSFRVCDQRYHNQNEMKIFCLVFNKLFNNLFGLVKTEPTKTLTQNFENSLTYFALFLSSARKSENLDLVNYVTQDSHNYVTPRRCWFGDSIESPNILKIYIVYANDKQTKNNGLKQSLIKNKEQKDITYDLRNKNNFFIPPKGLYNDHMESTFGFRTQSLLEEN